MDSRSHHTMEQQIAHLENQLAHKREALRKLADGQKIIIGGMVLALAERNSNTCKRLIKTLEKNVTREADVRRIKPLIKELKLQAARLDTERTAGRKAEKAITPANEEPTSPADVAAKEVAILEQQKPPAARGAASGN